MEDPGADEECEAPGDCDTDWDAWDYPVGPARFGDPSSPPRMRGWSDDAAGGAADAVMDNGDVEMEDAF